MHTASQSRLAAFGLFLIAALSLAQQPQQRTRLILKDGSYQVVLDYEVVGKVVRYRSAERDGAPEDIPLSMVDLPATERWRQQHSTTNPGPVLSPELAAEEAARHALRPEVAPHLHLPEEDSVLALDTYQSTPELVPLNQEGSDLNRETAHATLKVEVNPAAAPHQIAELAGATSDVAVHIGQPVFYVRVGDDDADAGGGGMVVNTHGASGRATPSGGDAQSGYVVERLDPRRDTRIVRSLRITQLDSGHPQPDIVELKQEALPGGHWLRLTPRAPLEPGEYALIEVLSSHELNLNVWDFSVNPNARESYEAIKPEVRKPIQLERRPH